MIDLFKSNYWLLTIVWEYKLTYSELQVALLFTSSPGDYLYYSIESVIQLNIYPLWQTFQQWTTSGIILDWTNELYIDFRPN